MTRRRTVEELELEPPEGTEAVVWRMDRLAEAHDGWINLLPGVPEEDVEAPTAGVFSAFFGTAQPPVSMCTWMPAGAPRARAARTGRAGRLEETVGVMHPRGRGAAGLLASSGVPLPAGWTLRQDHVRRGLLVRPAAGTRHDAVLAWMLAAGSVLSLVPLTGRWKARVYLPR